MIRSLFFFISLIIHSCAMRRHRNAGFGSKRLAPGAAEPYMMQPQDGKVPYAAVPQQGMPLENQQTSYDPHQMYSPPPPAAPQGGYYTPEQGQQGYYAPPPPQSTSPYAPQAGSPYAPPPADGSYPQAVSPQPPYQPPYQPPQHQ